ncbi:hypothetical protein SLS58_004184 [Diplodia intermedia]|uniref:Integral membrane protein n=1 Tax=Diplodia intermedia TaxID=856260 RepID=A0ABR3TUJ6_9PEZI
MEFRDRDGDGQPYPSEILPFMPDQFTGIVPFHNTSDYDWISGNELTGDNQNFSTQWVECFYPVSGTYAATPRLIYYVFILAALLLEYLRARFKIKFAWFQEAIVGVIMAYSSTTAVHALVLVSAWKRMAPDGLFDSDKHEIVQVEGNWTGTYQTATGLPYNKSNVQNRDGTRVLNDHLWMPLVPMVRDHDADPVLAVVGSAFLLYPTLHLWLGTMRRPEIRALRYLWWAFLLAGTVSALIYEERTLFWYMWQLRFCPTGARQQDYLPLANAYQGHYSRFSGRWDPHDRYRWNGIVGSEFVFGNSSIHFPQRCLYPCFEVDSWPFRDPSDIFVRRRHGAVQNVRGTGDTFLALYILVVVSSLSGLILIVLSSWLGVRTDREEKFKYFKRQIGYFWKTGLREMPEDEDEGEKETGRAERSNSRSVLARRLVRRSVVLLLVAVAVFTSFLAPMVCIFFVGYFEWKIFSTDGAGRETMRHIGQWGFLVSTVLSIIAAGLIEGGAKVSEWMDKMGEEVKSWIRPRRCGATDASGPLAASN